MSRIAIAAVRPPHPGRSLLTVAILYMLLAGALACSGAHETPDSRDTTPPTVSASIPAQGAVDVSTTVAPTVTFAEAMDAASVIAAFGLAGPDGAVTGTVTYDPSKLTATFAPRLPLAPATRFTATVGTGARDVAGNALARSYVFEFTTATTADTTPPHVIATSPDHGATGVPTTTTPEVTFDEPMDADSVAAAFALVGPRGAIAGAVSYDGETRTATFAPSLPLAPSTTFTATVDTAARDVAGNALAESRAFNFTTAGVPEVVGTAPPDGATDVSIDLSWIRIDFATAMDRDSVTGAFTLSAGGVPVPGTATYYEGEMAFLIFDPSGPLAGHTTYTGVISTAARTADLVPLSAAYSFSFTTGEGPKWTLLVNNSPNMFWLDSFAWVSDDQGQIECGNVSTRCSAAYDIGTTVTLAAYPGPMVVFKGWIGDNCPGNTAPSFTLSPTERTSFSCAAKFEMIQAATGTLSVSMGSWVARVFEVTGFGVAPRLDCGTDTELPSPVCSYAFPAAISFYVKAFKDPLGPAGTLTWTCTSDDLHNPPAQPTVVLTGESILLWMTHDKHCHVELVPLPPA